MLFHGRRIAVLDCESELIRRGLLAPPLVCTALLVETQPVRHPEAWVQRQAWLDGGVDYLGVLDKTDSIEVTRQMLEDPNVQFAGHNIAYDFGLMAAKDETLITLIFAAYEAGRVCDTRIREKLIRLAQGQMSSDFASGSKRQQKFGLGNIMAARWGLDFSADKNGSAEEQDDGTMVVTGEGWRLRFGELIDVPLDQWPQDALDYVKGDVYKTHKLLWAQVEDEQSGVVDPETGFVTNEAETVAAAWALHLAAIWGVRTDGKTVSDLAERLHLSVSAVKDLLADPAIGIFRHTGKKNTTRLKELICIAYGGEDKAPRVVHKPKKGEKKREYCGCAAPVWKRTTCQVCGGHAAEGISTEKEHLIAAPHERQLTVLLKREVDKVMKLVNVPVLEALASISADEHNGTTYIPAFSHGTIYPINCGWNELVESGRTSCWGPNWQNLPREGGYRECVVPRPGWIFANADYSTIELCALAQFCLDQFGESAMAVALQAGRDLHLEMAADLLNLSYNEVVLRKWRGDIIDPKHQEHNRLPRMLLVAASEWKCTEGEALLVFKAEAKEVKAKRQMAKALNFGFPGGLGAETLIVWAWKTYRVKFGETWEEAVRVAKAYKDRWLARWPEMRKFFAYISQATASGGGETTFVQPRSGRLRGGTGYCDGCNTHFQGLAADGAKAAMFFISQECYTGYSTLWTRAEHGDEKSGLWGSRLTIFVHDEFILEAVEWDAVRAAERLAVVMNYGMSLYIPDIPIKCAPVLMRRWYKDAESVYDADGTLIPWEPPLKEAA